MEELPAILISPTYIHMELYRIDEHMDENRCTEAAITTLAVFAAALLLLLLHFTYQLIVSSA